MNARFIIEVYSESCRKTLNASYRPSKTYSLNEVLKLRVTQLTKEVLDRAQN